MGLLLILDLQAMFNGPQENVSIAKQAHLVRRKNIQLFQGDQRFQAVALLEKGILGSVQQLQSLQDELDFPNPAVAELHVPVEIGQSDNVLFDPCFQRHDFVQQISGNGPRKNKRLQPLVKLVKEFSVPGHSPGLDQSHPFPGLTVSSIVILHAGERSDERSIPTFRAKPHVNAKQRVRSGRKNPDNALGQARKKLR